MPDPSYASPALGVASEDKSGTALAWVLFLRPSIVIALRWLGAGTGHRIEGTMSHDKTKAAARRRMAETDEPYATARREAIREHKALAQEVIACADRTLAAPSARITFHQEMSFSGLVIPAPRTPAGKLLRLAGRLAMPAARATWKRVTSGVDLRHMIGEGILEPANGRYMIDFGSYAEIRADGKTFAGRSGKRVEPVNLDRKKDDILWLLALVRGVTRATVETEEVLHGTPCRRMACSVDMAAASATGEGPRTPPVDHFEQLRALPITVWTEPEYIHQIHFDDPEGQELDRQLTLELWDFGTASGELDWSRLPTFRTPADG